MSRYSFINENGNEVGYGFDTHCGFFVQLYDTDENGDEVVPIDMDRFTHSRGEIFETMVELGVPKEHCDSVALDLPF